MLSSTGVTHLVEIGIPLAVLLRVTAAAPRLPPILKPRHQSPRSWRAFPAKLQRFLGLRLLMIHGPVGGVLGDLLKDGALGFFLVSTPLRGHKRPEAFSASGWPAG